MTGDRDLRLVYLEILFALHECGGELPSDPDLLQDCLGISAEIIAAKLPILCRFGEAGRGGLVAENGHIRNVRISAELAEEREFRESQSERGRASVESRKRRYGTARPIASPANERSRASEPPFTHERTTPERVLNALRTGPEPPTPTPTPVGEEKNGKKEDLLSGGEAPRLPPIGFDKNGRKLSEQQTRVQAAERIIFLQRGHAPPPASSIAKWLDLVDEDGLISVIEQLEGSGKMDELKDAGQQRTAYIFACVKSFHDDCSRMERGLPL